MGGFVMNRRKFIKNISVGTFGAALTLSPYRLHASKNNVVITILHTNDLHCHIEPFTGTNERYANKGGLARISGMVKKVREENPNTLLFDAGDMFQGTPYFNYFGGDLMVKLMSEMGYDAGTIGNHEFDNGLEGIRDALPGAKFPLINSNYDFSGTMLAGKFPPWKIFKRSGIKIGVYGLGIELKGLVSDKNYGKTVYHDPVAIALKMENFLKNTKNCDLVVCLSHLGLEYDDGQVSDRVLAAETRFTDLIIGGHTHTFLEKPLFLRNKDGRQVIVNQAWWGGLVLGRIDFVFEKMSRKNEVIYSENFY